MIINAINIILCIIYLIFKLFFIIYFYGAIFFFFIEVKFQNIALKWPKFISKKSDHHTWAQPLSSTCTAQVLCLRTLGYLISGSTVELQFPQSHLGRRPAFSRLLAMLTCNVLYK